MAGNKNSGRHGKTLPELIQQACRRAIKQGNAGLAGQRALSDLLAEQMQTDPLAFLRAVAPYVPKEIIIDQTISISDALLEARNRVIDMGQAQVIQDAPASILSAPDDTALVVDQSATLDVVTVQQGEGVGGVGAGS